MSKHSLKRPSVHMYYLMKKLAEGDALTEDLSRAQGSFWLHRASGDFQVNGGTVKSLQDRGALRPKDGNSYPERTLVLTPQGRQLLEEEDQ